MIFNGRSYILPFTFQVNFYGFLFAIDYAFTSKFFFVRYALKGWAGVYFSLFIQIMRKVSWR